jgi:hypothetical protein
MSLAIPIAAVCFAWILERLSYFVTRPQEPERIAMKGKTSCSK